MTTRSLIRAASAALLALVAVLPARAEDTSKFDPEKIKVPPLGRITVPEPERYVMPNGITVFLLTLCFWRGVKPYKCPLKSVQEVKWLDMFVFRHSSFGSPSVSWSSAPP